MVEADQYIAEAKRLLREQLRSHPDEGVRALNEVAEPCDNHPAVVKIAAALRVRARAQAGEKTS